MGDGLDSRIIHRLAPGIFRFLCEEHGFRLASETQAFLVRFEHEGGLHLVIAYDWRDRSIECRLEAEPAIEQGIPLALFLEELGCAREDYVDLYVHELSPEGRLTKLLELEAAAIRDTVKPADWSNQALLVTALEHWKEIQEKSTRRFMLQQLRRDADARWQARDFTGYVRLLRSHSGPLPAREARRLRYALRKLEKR